MPTKPGRRPCLRPEHKEGLDAIVDHLRAEQDKHWKKTDWINPERRKRVNLAVDYLDRLVIWMKARRP